MWQGVPDIPQKEHYFSQHIKKDNSTKPKILINDRS